MSEEEKLKDFRKFLNGMLEWSESALEGIPKIYDVLLREGHERYMKERPLDSELEIWRHSKKNTEMVIERFDKMFGEGYDTPEGDYIIRHNLWKTPKLYVSSEDYDRIKNKEVLYGWVGEETIPYTSGDVKGDIVHKWGAMRVYVDDTVKTPFGDRYQVFESMKIGIGGMKVVCTCTVPEFMMVFIKTEYAQMNVPIFEIYRRNDDEE